MRVLLLSNTPKIGGGNRSLMVLAQGLREHGVEVSIACLEPGDMVQLTHDSGFECHVIPFQQPSHGAPLQTWRGMSQWCALMRKLQIDIVHGNDLSSSRSASLAARWLGLPLVCHVRYPPDEAYVIWLAKRLPKPAVCIFNSHALKAEVGPFFDRYCPKSRQAVVHNAVELGDFKPRPQHRNGAPARIGIIANLLPVKGHIDFLDMAKVLTDRKVEARYLIIGEDVLGNGHGHVLREHVQKLGIESQVEFTGHVRDVPAMLQTLDIVVCSSHVEPFGRCVLEAMACQVPVVGTRVGGIPEVIDEGKTGLLVPMKDPRALADAVQKLAGDPNLRQAMGEAGRKRSAELFGVKKHVQDIRAIYDSLR